MRYSGALLLSLVMVGAVALAAPGGRAEAIIHEQIGAACRAGGEEVIPPGQAGFDQKSFLRALQASGVISSIVVVGNDTTINVDLQRPNSKFESAGFNLTIPDAFGPGADLTLAPLPVLDPDFAAHANCNNLRP